MSAGKSKDRDVPLPEAPPGTADDSVGAPAAEPQGAAQRASTYKETSEGGLAVSVVLC